jgi:hypothetical protein
MVTRSRSRVTSLLALLSVVFLLATACSDDSGDEASTDTTEAASQDGATTTTAAADEEPPSESPAASLRSDLTGLFEEQVYLTGYTVQAAVDGGGLDSPVASGYAVEAGHGADELANIVGGAYGVGAADDFVAAWNDHREAIVSSALENGSPDAVETARQGVLDALADMDAEASFAGVADRLTASDEALLTAVDAMVAGQPSTADLRDAAEEMPGLALDLGSTIAARMQMEGEIESPESELRADLTGELQESALLTGLGLNAIVRADGDAAGASDIRAVIDENTDDLAATMEPEDEATAAEFAQLWSGHIDAFEQYATALVGDDAQGIQDSQDALVQFRDDVGELLAADYPGFTQEQVAEELVDHTDSMLAYADALVREAGDLAEGVEETGSVADTPSEAPALLRAAALNMRLAARSLTGGLTAPASSGEADAAEEES